MRILRWRFQHYILFGAFNESTEGSWEKNHTITDDYDSRRQTSRKFYREIGTFRFTRREFHRPSTVKLPVSKENMATQQDAEKWSHLRDIEIPEIDAEVSLLIGSDVPQALGPLEIRRGQRGEPSATGTALGWVVNDPLGRNGDAPHSVSFINADVQLNEQFEKFCNMEFNDSAFSNEPSMSQEDRRALDIMNESIKLEEGHYEMALPWRKHPPELPNNKSLAEHRLKLLK